LTDDEWNCIERMLPGQAGVCPSREGNRLFMNADLDLSQTGARPSGFSLRQDAEGQSTRLQCFGGAILIVGVQ
jgi:hypothetical protein